MINPFWTTNRRETFYKIIERKSGIDLLRRRYGVKDRWYINYIKRRDKKRDGNGYDDFRQSSDTSHDSAFNER